VEWKKLVGDEAIFTVEHRILNTILLFGISICVFAGFFNMIFEFGLLAAVSAITGITLLVLYYYSLIKHKYKTPLYIVIFTMFILIPVIWLFNGGISGGAPFYILIFSNAIAGLFRGAIKTVLFAGILTLSLCLITTEYFYPTLIWGYSSVFDRYADHSISFLINFVVNVTFYGITFKEFEKAYEKAKKYAVQIQKQENQIQMSHFERLTLIGEMAASIAHEIRNPLTTVRGYLQFFRNKNEFVTYREQMDVMINEIDRTNDIISEFLALSKDKVVIVKPVNLNGVVSALSPLIKATFACEGKKIYFETGSIPLILADENEMRQLILNLVKNAQEATNRQGEIILSTRFNKGWVELIVKDNGCGIPPAIFEKLGTPFLTSKEKGTGLGLTVCYRIIERHDGVLSVQTSSAGTVFSVKFKQLPGEYSSKDVWKYA